MEPMRFGEAPRRRGPSLTPMIDVVFLLLVFFMLAARFGMEEAVPLGVAGSGGAYEGPPRLIEVRPDGLLLNGVVVAETALAEALAALTQGPDDLVVLRGRDGADTESIVRALDLLAAAGHRRVALVE